MTPIKIGPQATVIIPTKNRCQSLCETIESVLQQSIAVEIIVLDDGSTDGTHEVVQKKFPTVRVLRDEESKGPTYQRNRGTLLANTPFLFTIDDDCTFPEPRIMEETLAAFENLRVGAVTIPFVNVLQSPQVLTAAPDSEKIYAAYEYYGGMVAFRREAFLKVGGYRTQYFMHVEEPDLSLRLLNAGYIVRPGVTTPMHHHESPIRNRMKLHELGPRNHVLYAWYNVPSADLCLHLLATSMLCVWHTVKIGHPWLGVRGVLRGYVAAFRERKNRLPVSRQIYRLSRQLRNAGALPLAEIEHCLPTLKPTEDTGDDNA